MDAAAPLHSAETVSYAADAARGRAGGPGSVRPVAPPPGTPRRPCTAAVPMLVERRARLGPSVIEAAFGRDLPSIASKLVPPTALAAALLLLLRGVGPGGTPGPSAGRPCGRAQRFAAPPRGIAAAPAPAPGVRCPLRDPGARPRAAATGTGAGLTGPHERRGAAGDGARDGSGAEGPAAPARAVLTDRERERTDDAADALYYTRPRLRMYLAGPSEQR